MADTVLVQLPEPPVVRQGNRHICWAAAYESWARVLGYNISSREATNLFRALSRMGHGDFSAVGPVVDQNERMIPDGLGIFAHVATMRLWLWSPRRLTAELLAQQMRHGHVWLWAEPIKGSVAHVVVVYAVLYDENNVAVVLYMDPNRGLVRDLWRDVLRNTRIFAVGTPLVMRAPSDPFAGLQSNEVHRYVAPDPFLSLL